MLLPLLLLLSLLFLGSVRSATMLPQKLDLQFVSPGSFDTVVGDWDDLSEKLQISARFSGAKDCVPATVEICIVIHVVCLPEDPNYSECQGMEKKEAVACHRGANSGSSGIALSLATGTGTFDVDAAMEGRFWYRMMGSIQCFRGGGARDKVFAYPRVFYLVKFSR